VNHVEDCPDVHGGVFRCWIAPTEDVSEECEAFFHRERTIGVTEFAYYMRFASRVDAIRNDLRGLLESLRARGYSIVGYGADANGATLLNASGVGREFVDFVVDPDVHKQGKQLPGVRLPIRAPEVLLEEQPDYVLLLAWSEKDDIAAEQSEYLVRGGRFIVPVPSLAIL
jgi:hypothetical protein